MDENFNKADKLANDVLKLSRNTLLVNLRFLDVALSRFTFLPYDGTLGVCDEKILYNPMHILKRYKNEKEASVRDYLHLVFHCVFRHAFVNELLNTDMWDLACDIAVENVINELNLKSVTTTYSEEQIREIESLKKKVNILTAEKIYAYLIDSNLSEQNLSKLISLFRVDDHSLWYLPYLEVAGNISGDIEERAPNRSIINKHPNGQDESENDSQSNGSHPGTGRNEMEQVWKDIAERIQTDLETFSKQRGDTAGSMVQNLKSVTREKYDYTSFLKRFATLGEAMKINDDEFDYIFYTYGMKLYDKMPLIEPLEYKEVKRIKEFVIAIDTSGSVQGELVQKFLNKTYNILQSEESFFTKINVHLIQCDADIQQDVKITNKEEFEEYIKDMKLFGFGGTDFRPVFTYVNQLIDNKEFSNLKGIIYFTDGLGVFPEKKPKYDTAFVFIDDDYSDIDVPPWAIKLVLRSEEV